MKTVILAGGKGTRLKPYTAVFPKPLMPVGDKPILEIIIRQLKSCGLEDIIITVGHLGELIMNFFGDGSKLGVKIAYSREDKPLGTTGSLGMLKADLKDTFLVINGDTLTTLNYTDIIAYHRDNNAMATLALNKRDVYIDFGVVDTGDRNDVRNYTEKPTVNYLVSLGVNVFEPGVLKYVPEGERLDFPDLVKTLIDRGERVVGYPFEGYWLDIGRREDYEKVNEDTEEINRLFNL